MTNKPNTVGITMECGHIQNVPEYEADHWSGKGFCNQCWKSIEQQYLEYDSIPTIPQEDITLSQKIEDYGFDKSFELYPR